MKAEEAYKELEETIKEMNEGYLEKGGITLSIDSRGRSNVNKDFMEIVKEYFRYKEDYYDYEVRDSDENIKRYNKKALELICDSVKELIK